MPVVDVAFRVQGAEIPADHGYLLAGALSRIMPTLHADETVAIAPIRGQPTAGRRLRLTPYSRLVVRTASERIAELLPLAGKSLRVGDGSLLVGIPEIRPLIPTATLFCRLVVIKGFMQPDPFLAAVQRQLDGLGIRGKPALIPQPEVAAANADSARGSHSPFVRRTLRIRDKEVVGFAVRVSQLTAEESVLLQEKGIGGRRRFGCGVFVAESR